MNPTQIILMLFAYVSLSCQDHISSEEQQLLYPKVKLEAIHDPIRNRFWSKSLLGGVYRPAKQNDIVKSSTNRRGENRKSIEKSKGNVNEGNYDTVVPEHIYNVIRPEVIEKMSDIDPSVGHTDQMNKLIYNMVEDEQKEEVLDKYETIVLKTMELNAKLDKKIDETTLILQVLTNLRHHLKDAHEMAKQMVNSKEVNDKVKQYVLTKLDGWNRQVEQTLLTITPKMAQPNPYLRR